MKKKLAIFDMDGTVYLGNHLIDGSKDTFDYLIKNNINYVFVTNNSSHDIKAYENKMKKLGIPCNSTNFYSSAEVTRKYLLEKNIKTIYVLGNKCLKDLLTDFMIVDHYDSSIKIDAVVAGFDTELVYDDLKVACLYLQTQDCLFLATNGDFRCPIEDGLFIPDCGGMCEWIRLCTGKTVQVLGKPAPNIINDMLERFNVKKEETIALGDRLYTDIEAANNAGVDSVAVLSGECTLEDIKAYKSKPKYILNSIKELPSLLNKI